MKPLLLDHPPELWLLPCSEKYRQAQVADWIFKKRASSFAEMSNLSAALRTELAEAFDLAPLTLVTCQGDGGSTRKYLWRLRDGSLIESVLIPATEALYGEKSDRMTLCVSTQVGCAYGCHFCASGLDGWKRNLSPGEIVGQILEAERQSGERVNNLVFMGMGEPLANFDSLMSAIETINCPEGLNIGARHITISTSGLAPRIRDLAHYPKQLRLAISLHGATDEVRERIMPVNKKHPLRELVDACLFYQQHKGRIITLEYILIQGVNDSLDQAQKLAQLAGILHAKVNLIPYNTVEGLPWERPPQTTVTAFAKTVQSRGVTATVRTEKGGDIDAACGQLRLKTEQAAARQE